MVIRLVKNFPTQPIGKIILPSSARTLEISSPIWLNWPIVSAKAQNNLVKKATTTSFPDWQKPFVGVQNFEARVIFVDSDGQIFEQSTITEIYFFLGKG